MLILKEPEKQASKTALRLLAAVTVSAQALLLPTSCPASDHDLAENCPVRTEGFPSDGSDLSMVRLTADGREVVSLLEPRETGLFVVRVDQPSSTWILASYRAASEVRTVEYPLSLGLAGLEWRTAAAREDPESMSAEVAPGLYRVVLKYVSSFDRSLVCVAISPSISLSDAIYLHRFE